MTYDWNKDYNRFAIARNILLQIVDSIYAVNNEVEFGVRLYGSEHPAQEKNCTDSKLLVPFNLQNVNQIKRSLQYSNAIGWSPIAYSLQQSAEKEINNTSLYDYSIIFVTDGGESCGGDICKTYADLLQKKVSVTPYIIGLDNNATLKGYYNCLGKYVSVLDVSDIPKAVKLIVDENRPIIDKKKRMNLKTVYSNSPVKKSTKTKPKIVKPTPKVVKQAPRIKYDLDLLTLISPTLDLLNKTKLEQLVPLNERPLFTSLIYNFDYKVPPPPVVRRTIPSLETLEAKSIAIAPARIEPLKALSAFPLFNKLEYTFDLPVANKIDPEINELEPLRLFAARYRYVYAFRIPTELAAKPLFKELRFDINYTPIKRDTIIKRIGAKPKNISPKPNGKPGSPNVKVSREVVPSDETMVQIFFVNKYQKKKMYRNATPMILVKDASSNKEVKRFIRKVRGGAPELEKVAAGTYNFMVRGSNSLITPDIRIDDKSINKIYIEVHDGTIEFAYSGNMGRPVNEFQAIVNPRFEKGQTVVQECKEKLYYSPATYYIEINTNPTTRFAMVELDFGEVKIIAIDEPGFVQITNSNRLGEISFLCVRNDKYVRFSTMKVGGNVIDQKQQMQPGKYKVSYDKRPGVPMAGTIEKFFTVRSNETTQLLLE